MTRDFWIVFIAAVFLNMGLNISGSVLPVHAQAIGCTGFHIGLVTGIFAVSSCMLKIFSAPAIDSFDRRKLVSAALIAMTISYVIYSMAFSEELLIAASLLRGGAQAFTATGCLVLASSCLEGDKMSSGVSTYSLSQIVCQAIGPSIAMNLAVLIGYNATYLVSVACSLASIVLLTRVKRVSRGEKPFRIAWDRILCPRVFGFAFIGIFLHATVFAVISFMAVFEMDLGIPQETTGIYFIVYVAVLTVTRPLIGRLGDNYPPRRVMMLTLAVLIAAFVALGLARSIVGVLIAAVLNAIGISSMPLLQANAYKVTDESIRGAVTCTFYLGLDVGTFMGPVVSGFFVDFGGYSFMWMCMALFAAIALAASLIVRWDK